MNKDKEDKEEWGEKEKEKEKEEKVDSDRNQKTFPKVGFPIKPVSVAPAINTKATFFFLFLFLVLGFELRASQLLHKYSTTWATPPAPKLHFKYVCTYALFAVHNSNIVI
jgi:hypothetical protein